MPSLPLRAFVVLGVVGAVMPAQSAIDAPPANGPSLAAGRVDLPATFAALRAHVDRGLGDGATVADAGWQIQAFLAGDSTLRSGPSREHIKMLVRWCRDAQDPHGWFAPGGTRATRIDQLVAAIALRNTWVLSHYRLVEPIAARAGTAALGAFTAADAPPATAEEAALLALLADDVRLHANQRELTVDQAQLADGLREQAQRAAEQLTYGATRRGDAALQLARQRLGEVTAPDLVAARVWPADLASDPLHTYFALHAMAPHPERLRRHEPEIARLYADLESSNGLAEAARGLDAATTTAMRVVALQLAAAALRTEK